MGRAASRARGLNHAGDVTRVPLRGRRNPSPQMAVVGLGQQANSGLGACVLQARAWRLAVRRERCS